MSLQMIVVVVASIIVWETSKWIHKELKFRVLERGGRAFAA